MNIDQSIRLLIDHRFLVPGPLFVSYYLLFIYLFFCNQSKPNQNKIQYYSL